MACSHHRMESKTVSAAVLLGILPRYPSHLLCTHSRLLPVKARNSPQVVSGGRSMRGSEWGRQSPGG